jgi:RES domain-containing protein
LILFKTANANYIGGFKDYHKTRSFKEGARWNSAGTPVLYFSSNVQNAMLELANYQPDPVIANHINVMGVFETPALRLYMMTPEELPQGWSDAAAPLAAQELGDKYLNDDRYDGFVVPSCTMNVDLAQSPLNEVRASIYANVVLNAESDAVSRIQLTETFSPIYSARMFNPT